MVQAYCKRNGNSKFWWTDFEILYTVVYGKRRPLPATPIIGMLPFIVVPEAGGPINGNIPPRGVITFCMLPLENRNVCGW